MKETNNQAFIDGQNLYMNTRASGWTVDLVKFRIYLRGKKKRFCKLLAPNRHSTSSLYRVFTPRYVGFLNDKDAKKKISLAA